MKYRFSYYKEKYGAIIYTTIVCIILYFCQDTKFLFYLFNDGITEPDFLSALLTVLSITFGFLLTSFISLSQSSSPSMQLLRSHRRFHELAKYNKAAIYSTLITIILTTILLMLKTEFKDTYYYDCFKSVWSIFAVYTLFTTYRFLSIFYSLVIL